MNKVHHPIAVWQRILSNLAILHHRVFLLCFFLYVCHSKTMKTKKKNEKQLPLSPFFLIKSRWGGQKWAVTQSTLADSGVASCQPSSSSTAPDAVGTGSASAPNATQRASAEAAMMAKALASLTASSATPLASSSAASGGGGGGSGVNKPAILSAILRTAVPGKTTWSLSLSALSATPPPFQRGSDYASKCMARIVLTISKAGPA